MELAIDPYINMRPSFVRDLSEFATALLSFTIHSVASQFSSFDQQDLRVPIFHHPFCRHLRMSHFLR